MGIEGSGTLVTILLSTYINIQILPILKFLQHENIFHCLYFHTSR